MSCVRRRCHSTAAARNCVIAALVYGFKGAADAPLFEGCCVEKFMFFVAAAAAVARTPPDADSGGA